MVLQIIVHQLCKTLGGGGLVTKLCPTFATPWTVAHQAPLSMGFSRQEYWSRLPFPSPRHLQTYFDLFSKLLQLWKDCGKMGGMLGGSENKSELYVYYDYNFVKICMQITRTRKNSQMWNQLVKIVIWMIVFPFSELFSMLYSFYNHKSPEKKKVTWRGSCRSKDEKALLSKELRKGFMRKVAIEFQEEEEAEGIKTWRQERKSCLWKTAKNPNKDVLRRAWEDGTLRKGGP